MLDSFAKEVLLKEMEFLQTRFDKYDDLIWRNRSIFSTIVIAIVGIGIANNEKESFTLWISLSLIITGLFYIQEIVFRVSYVYRYVSRYRLIRDSINGVKDLKIEDLKLYDLTNRLGPRPKLRDKITTAVLRGEAFLFYFFSALIIGIFYWVSQNGL